MKVIKISMTLTMLLFFFQCPLFGMLARRIRPLFKHRQNLTPHLKFSSDKYMPKLIKLSYQITELRIKRLDFIDHNGNPKVNSFDRLRVIDYQIKNLEQKKTNLHEQPHGLISKKKE